MNKTFIVISLILIAFEAKATTGIFLKSNSKVYATSSASSANFIFGSSDTADTTYRGDYRMFLHKSKASFAAGEESFSEDLWRDDNLGEESMIFGYNSEVSGDRSISFGYINDIQGDDSLNIGGLNISTADNAINIGNFIDNSGENTIVVGRGAASKMAGSQNNSLYMGLMSSAPTLYVAPASGGSTTGRVGIGNSNPHADAALDIDGAIKVGVVDVQPTCDAENAGMIVFYTVHSSFKGCRYFGDGLYAWTLIRQDI